MKTMKYFKHYFCPVVGRLIVYHFIAYFEILVLVIALQNDGMENAVEYIKRKQVLAPSRLNAILEFWRHHQLENRVAKWLSV